MPLTAYFWKIGAVLLALLFVADFCLPKLPITVNGAADRPAIRIHSDQKWPERVVLDTNSPPVVAPEAVATNIETAAPPVLTRPSATKSDRSSTADALALLPRPGSRSAESTDHKQQRRSHHVSTRTKGHVTPRPIPAVPQTQFAWFGFRYW
ncbi:hypothetical protein AYJ54_34080 [Bradyrhizobium centrolobii]|uniref:Uncharacterized protein n=1 Tax=Bradyrhizobium centrolobii TaxID=1505087 RepID=A0A176YA90_9BRAD|nr:hypothetical protein [Bradyrhizobium centrolobii]OAE98580.1 hypothetical protein AYJ54_34080 [Bradyrhizobium centrolobii]